MKNEVVIALNWLACLQNIDRLKGYICNITDAMQGDGTDNGPDYQFFNKGFAFIEDAQKKMSEDLLPILKAQGYAEAIETLQYEDP